jgi:hypothetical protein
LTPVAVVRIAHAYGNRRSRIADALAADIDLIETDLRYEHGQIRIRHERRFGRLPLLYDRGLRGLHRRGPWALNIGSYFLRLDVRPMQFAEVLRLVSGRGGLMIDLKRAPYSDAVASAYIHDVLRQLEESRFEGAVDFCGSWRFLDLVRARRPDQSVHYSVDNEGHWEQLQPRLRGSDAIRNITIHPNLLTNERARLLRAEGIEYYMWDIEDAGAAERAIASGASGIIADDLTLLRSMAGRSPHTGTG